jgi:hypothetical protein
VPAGGENVPVVRAYGPQLCLGPLAAPCRCGWTDTEVSPYQTDAKAGPYRTDTEGSPDQTDTEVGPYFK